MADVEPIVGRYLRLTLGGRPHRVYFEEAGQGIPLVCLHTAGADNRQYRHLLNDTAITRDFRVLAFDMPWHGKSLPPLGWQDEEYRLTTSGYIEMIRAAGEELHEVVNHILELTRFQSKKSVGEIRKVDLGKTLEGVAFEIEDELREKNIQLKLELGRHATVYGDAGQIRQIFESLIHNAVKFSRPDFANQIGVQTSKHGDMLKVCVYDHGIGIEEKDQELIFDEFRQADGELTRGYGGTGLGLAIAKKIVERHGGRIWVESKKGGGSQFFFTLPLKPGSVDVKEVDTHRD